MKINPVVAREVKERLLSMCTHDCRSFMEFRALLESEHEDAVGVRLQAFFNNLNEILKLCGAPTND